MSRWKIKQGDCLDVLKECPSDFFDSLCTDPPAGVNFMGRNWDSDKGGRDQWITWLEGVMREAYRCLKPGGHCLVWALPRTSHWTATAIEDAGFEIRDMVTHHFGSGFPKSADISKAIDKLAGVEPLEVKAASGVGFMRPDGDWNVCKNQIVMPPATTEEAKAWSGWGTALKPSTEHWILARKPLAEKSIARQVLANGCGGLNIDACRVSMTERDGEARAKTRSAWSKSMEAGTVGNAGQHVSLAAAITGDSRLGSPLPPLPEGRFPPNLLLSHAPDCGIECVESCPVAELDKQSGDRPGMQRRTLRRGSTTGTSIGGHDAYGTAAPQEVIAGYSDSGGASRFFPTFRYQAKPSRSEKEAGLDSLPISTLNRVNPGGIENDPRWAPVQVRNNHPTVKSIELCRWLVRLITPPNGAVLDPFMGSGSIGAAALLEGFDFFGIDESPDYCAISEARLRHWANQ